MRQCQDPSLMPDKPSPEILYMSSGVLRAAVTWELPGALPGEVGGVQTALGRSWSGVARSNALAVFGPDRRGLRGTDWTGTVFQRRDKDCSHVDILVVLLGDHSLFAMHGAVHEETVAVCSNKN